MKAAFVSALIAIFCQSAHADLITVSSLTDGNGMFSYTFSPGDEQLFYNMGASGSGGVRMILEGVQSVTVPDGWEYVVLDEPFFEGWYRFRSTEPTFILDSGSVTISIVSIYTNSAEYSGDPNYVYPPDHSIPFCMGIAGGQIANEAHEIISGGSEYFTFIGPASVPEPTSALLLMIGIGILTLSGKRFAQPRGRGYGSPAAGSPSPHR